MANGSGVSRGDRNRNVRLARLRVLVPHVGRDGRHVPVAHTKLQHLCDMVSVALARAADPMSEAAELGIQASPNRCHKRVRDDAGAVMPARREGIVG
jgi:hypothetical protein